MSQICGSITGGVSHFCVRPKVLFSLYIFTACATKALAVLDFLSKILDHGGCVIYAFTKDASWVHGLSLKNCHWAFHKKAYGMIKILVIIARQ